jgi:hypothetical protein
MWHSEWLLFCVAWMQGLPRFVFVAPGLIQQQFAERI